MISDELKIKLNKLKDYLAGLQSVAVGFSGGVDSTFLLTVAHEVLGDNAVAVTASDEAFPEREMEETKTFCAEHGIRQIIVRTNPLEIEEYRHNAPDRCYHCKKSFFTQIKKIADENGLEYVAEGSNTDDTGDYRPGMRAVAELGIVSPLREAGLSKADIRALSKEMGLPTWSKPSYACLASRFVYGEEISAEKLHMIDRAEQFLIELGFIEERVRMHGNLARIEVPASDIPKISSDEFRMKIYDEFRKIGFSYISLDLKGYRTGSMNETLDENK